MRCSTILTIIVSMTITLGLAAPVFAGSYNTTKAASTGTVDESSTKKVQFSAERAMIKRRFDEGRVILRYDIDIDNVTRPNDVLLVGLSMSYRDNGQHARVIAKLKRRYIGSGPTETLLVLDSDDYRPDSEFLLNTTFNRNPSHSWQPQFAYWVEVTLIKTGTSGRPELGMIMVQVTTAP